MKIKTKKFFLLSVFLLSGCASTLSLKPEDKVNIHNVSISPQVTIPPNMYYFGPDLGTAGFFLGAIGAVTTASTEQANSANIIEYARKNNIDIRQIVLKQIQTQLPEKTSLKVVKKNPDAILQAQILLYGLSIPHAFSSELLPLLAVQLQLKQGNKIIWEDSARIFTIGSGMPEHSLTEIRKDPTVLANMWNKAAEKVIGEAIVGLK